MFCKSCDEKLISLREKEDGYCGICIQQGKKPEGLTRMEEYNRGLGLNPKY